jgi:acyl carrier protein
MEQQLRDIVARIAETQPTFPDAVHLRDDLRVDSVRVMELVFEIEQTFAVKFPEDRYAEVSTFNDLVNVVRSLKL